MSIFKLTILFCLALIISCGSEESSEQVESSEAVDQTELTFRDNAKDLSSDEIRNLLHGTWTMRGQTVIIDPGGTAQFREVYKDFQGEWMEGTWELDGTDLILVLKKYEQRNRILGINSTTLRMSDPHDRPITAQRE